jgi:hypothetical protein
MEKQAVFTKIMPPRIQDVKIYFSQKGISDLEADHFFLYYEKKQWKNKNGLFLKSWKNCAWNWIKEILRDQPWLFNKNVH